MSCRHDYDPSRRDACTPLDAGPRDYYVLTVLLYFFILIFHRPRHIRLFVFRIYRLASCRVSFSRLSPGSLSLSPSFLSLSLSASSLSLLSLFGLSFLFLCFCLCSLRSIDLSSPAPPPHQPPGAVSHVFRSSRRHRRCKAPDAAAAAEVLVGHTSTPRCPGAIQRHAVQRGLEPPSACDLATACSG